ncbi:hypothetical protein CBG46_01125 [Actinobacillus succinogenes]|uniref:Nucleotidyltransferase substrate binding protein, HI0074 family n=1 Tax=Actinobacillus succinogenes (strain ATCC 55618 / DSM 22257 / CCUG 43843 / 130Z) TaxID=339671 RepID=A6VMK0_ACTSZ|nr:nucleotidyltransferase substrate binding protein [Actinobacillus succinogenes]ABR74197.1 nucleotidyltransferase substrate binding protein, HI0074 family [Actinobacillus succinogenes 130Z]PHI39372.1 hypothetical protein CBG46_01125 [Actinobacillus succinogenes]
MSEQYYLDFSSLENVFISLEQTIEKLDNYEWFSQQDLIIQDTLIAGAIQKFEFVYELAIKMMKRHIKFTASNDQDIDNADFREILRTAAQIGLIENIEDWFDYRKMRNITSHTYDQSKARQVYQQIADFLLSCQYLILQLQKYKNSYA